MESGVALKGRNATAVRRRQRSRPGAGRPAQKLKPASQLGSAVAILYFKPIYPNQAKMSSIASHRYDIMYDFAEDILSDWEPVPDLQVQEHAQQQRPVSPHTATANTIYDLMAGVYMAETHDDFALEYAAVANYILDNAAQSVPFLIAAGPIRNALRTFSEWMEMNYPAAITITSQLVAQLDIIKMEHGE